ncbi:MAG TPA: Rieske (2Fe-2S) protein [Candidatus Binatia bacterium]|nr:Rieske (2Fe-2S) protein [Candidatus Binatia bacterium]
MLKRPDPSFPRELSADRRLERRRFLRTLGSAAVVTLVAEWWTARTFDEAHSHTPEVRLATRDEPAVGQARALEDAGGEQVLVVRLDEASLVAFDRRCPHLGCPVLWSAERGRFECPCHRAAFDARTGRVLFGPPRRGLTPAHVTVA